MCISLRAGPFQVPGVEDRGATCAAAWRNHRGEPLSVGPKPLDVSSLAEEAKRAFVSGGGRKRVEIDVPAGCSLGAMDYPV